jgi:RNA polymerase sigma-70 factor, ECF subfamily
VVATRLHDPSLEDLFRESYARLVASLSMAFGWPAAEDAVQEAFARAAARWERIGRHDNPGAWIRRVAINKLIDGRRRGVRRKAAEARASQGDALDSPTDSAQDVEAALAALTERQRLYVVLHYVDDLKIREIAELMSVSESAVKSGLSDARRKLFEELGDDDES